MTKKRKPVHETFETFRRMDAWTLSQHLRQDQTSCFNGNVEVRKYRVTIEEIEEPVEVLRERLQDLWDHMQYNMHSHAPMQAVAADLGFELEGSMGRKREKI
jgi:hypothetical protein